MRRQNALRAPSVCLKELGFFQRVTVAMRLKLDFRQRHCPKVRNVPEFRGRFGCRCLNRRRRKTPAHLLRSAIARATRPPLMRAERTTLLTSELREARDKGVMRELAARHVDNERGGDIGEEAEEATASSTSGWGPPLSQAVEPTLRPPSGLVASKSYCQGRGRSGTMTLSP